MKQSEKTARRLVRQANGLSPGFRYYDNPYVGQSELCPLCESPIAAGLELCPACGQPIPGRQRSREKLRKAPPVIVLALCFLAVLGLGLYFFFQTMIESGSLALLLGR